MADRLTITVSQLRCACVDRAWRARWLAGEDPPTMSFGGTNGIAVQGALFHRLVEQFIDWLCAQKTKQTAALADSEGLWAALHDRFAHTHLARLAGEGRLPSAHHLAQALRAFCAQAAALRARVPAFRSWQDVWLTQEFRLTPVKFEFSGRSDIFVSGRPDAVRLRPDAGVEVIDYKLSRGRNLKHDLVQLAVYARLLRENKPGLRFSGVLEFYEPALHSIPVSAGELDGIFGEIVEPVLAELAGTGSSTPPGEMAAGEIGELIEKCYAAFKLTVRVLGRQEAPQLVRYRVQPGSGVKVVSLANRAEDLQVALRLPQPPLIQPASGCVTIDIPKERPDTVHWRNANVAAAKTSHPLSFVIGAGISGELMTADLADPNTCHALVAGASGSGKSEFLKSMVASLIARNSPSDLRVSLVDPKTVTFGALKSSPHLSEPVISDLAVAISRLEMATEEMDRRYERLASAGLENVAEFQPREHMPYHVFVFDEFGDFILQGKREKEQFETLVARLAQKGRAAGFHLVLATQRPDAKVVTGLIKSNLPLKVCLRVTGAVNAQIVLGEPGAESLLGRGDLLCDRGRGIERAQSPFISQDELRSLVAREI